MLFGFDSFAAQPFATTNPGDGSVLISVNPNNLILDIGLVGVAATSITEIPSADPFLLKTGTVTIRSDVSLIAESTPFILKNSTVTAFTDITINTTNNPLTLSTGTVIINAGANVIPTGLSLNLKSNNSNVITWNDIDPDANNVWVEIKPY